MKYFIYDNCYLRLAALPIDSIVDTYNNSKDIDLTDNVSVKGLLDDLFSNSFFRKAVYISSKELYLQYEKIKNDTYPDTKELKNFLITFCKYYSRMASRTTPFGLFAGTTFLNINSDPTTINFEDSKFTVKNQFSLFPIVNLIRQIDATQEPLNTKLKYFVNNTSYTIGERLFYIEQFDKNGFPASNLNSIVLNEYTSSVLSGAKYGATINELIQQIPNKEISGDRKSAFIKNLIESQVLVNELWPSVSTDDFVSDLLVRVKRKSFEIPFCKEIEVIHELFKKIDTIDTLPLLEEFTNNRPDLTVLKTKDIVKTDLFVNLRSKNINENAIKDICKISFELMAINDPIRESEYLQAFKLRYYQKFEDREMPLVQALDPNYGVGYGLAINGGSEYMPLLEGLPVSVPADNPRRSKITNHEIVLNKVFRQFIEEKHEVVNIDKFVQEFINKTDSNLDEATDSSSFVFGRILTDSAVSLDNLDYKFVPVLCHAASAPRLLSRFANGDLAIKEQLKKIAADEQELFPDVIFAEVVTIPDAEYANICLYPVIRQYEIPFISNSGLPNEFQIDINDIMVSIKNKKVILISRKLNKEIVPCLSNAYNVQKATPIYRFLSDVSTQSTSYGYSWDWGVHYNEIHLPRVEYKKFILSRERWLVKKEKLKFENDASLPIYIKELRERLHIPRYVAIIEGDNELFLDLENIICCHIIVKDICKKTVVLYEFLQTPDNCFIKDAAKSYANSILITMGANKSTPAKALYEKKYRPIGIEKSITRIFPPGSDWLFVKFYSGSKILEGVLTDIIADFSAKLVEEAVIDKWFFIRYNDPNYHLRIRFHKSSRADNFEWYLIMENLQTRLTEYVSQEHAVTLMTDTYVREIERYGSHVIEFSEYVFYQDSIAVSKFLCQIYGNEGEILRWKFALVSVDRLLNDFDFDQTTKLSLLERLNNDFIKEFSNADKNHEHILLKNLNTKYRRYKQEICEIVEGDSDLQFQELYECFDYRSAEIKKEYNKISQFDQNEKNGLIAKYIHMSINRIFLVNARRHELIIYHFLKSYYKSSIEQLKSVNHDQRNRIPSAQ